jgi:hypothetical protein
MRFVALSAYAVFGPALIQTAGRGQDAHDQQGRIFSVREKIWLSIATTAMSARRASTR